MDTNKSIIVKLLENVPLAILVIGVVVFLLGATGGYPPLYVADSAGRIGLVLFGIILTAIGIFLLIRDRKLSSKHPVEKENPITVIPKNREQINNNSKDSKEFSKLFLFGYFFFDNGQEDEVLVFNTPNTPYFIFGETEENKITIENTMYEEIDLIVSEAIKKNGITLDDLFRAGASQPVYHRIFLKKEINTGNGNKLVALPKPYIFFKIRLQKRISGSNFRWMKKRDIRDSLINSSNPTYLPPEKAAEIIEAFRSDLIYKQLGRTVLECVDVLIFREDKQQIKFLLIRRQNTTLRTQMQMQERWEYPKGGLWYHETLLDAVYREVKEETSITPRSLKYCSDLGWQTVDVSQRKKPYDTLRVHGFTFLYTGNPDLGEGFSEEHHDLFGWFTIDEAKEKVWMKENDYAVEFFKRWEKNKDEILRKARTK